MNRLIDQDLLGSVNRETHGVPVRIGRGVNAGLGIGCSRNGIENVLRQLLTEDTPK
jgi:hypothetical protein